MMKPQSSELHSVKNRFGQKRFYDPGEGCRRFCPKAFANERIRIVRISGGPPINDYFSGLRQTFSRRQSIGFLALIHGSQRRQKPSVRKPVPILSGNKKKGQNSKRLP